MLLITLLAYMVLMPAQPALPSVQGAWLMPAQPLPEFELEQHDGAPVSADTLPGPWRLISYGFTHCPDICPTTLIELAQFKRSLDQQQEFNDLEVHFYTIDPGRDSLEQLSRYLPWFHDDFSGWRASSERHANTFESSLGINATVRNNSDGTVDVTHGLKLFLLDAKGRLQVVLEPTRTLSGQLHYQPDVLLKDYKTVRRWVGS
jgi:protein SCO1/2